MHHLTPFVTTHPPRRYLLGSHVPICRLACSVCNRIIQIYVQKMSHPVLFSPLVIKACHQLKVRRPIAQSARVRLYATRCGKIGEDAPRITCATSARGMTLLRKRCLRTGKSPKVSQLGKHHRMGIKTGGSGGAGGGGFDFGLSHY